MRSVELGSSLVTELLLLVTTVTLTLLLLLLALVVIVASGELLGEVDELIHF